MTNTTDKGAPLMKPTFFDDNDPNNPKRKTYIECEAVLKIIYDIKENKEIPKNYGTLLDIIRSIRNLPTADVVEVVRCKDCIFSRPVIGTAYLKFCKKFDYEMWHEGFCYYGEKIGD